MEPWPENTAHEYDSRWDCYLSKYWLCSPQQQYVLQIVGELYDDDDIDLYGADTTNEIAGTRQDINCT